MDNNARIDLERRLPKRAMALILAGGRGSRLKQLTDTRCKPAVYFGGHFRIIDFVLSNCMNSGLRRIGVLTQYKSHSLLRHLQRGWNFLKSEMHEFVDLIPAQQRVDEEYWYRGTADAVYQSLDIIKSNKPEYVVILAGDHIYKMDYARMLADHALSGAGVTVGCIEVDRQEAKAFGVMAIDENKKVTSFVEKPADPPAMPGKPDRSLASMGIYIFTADYLYRMLDEDIALEGSSHDFGKDIIPKAVGEGQVVAHFFQDSCVYNSEKAPAYWRDVGTIDAYWEANIDLTATVPELNLYDRSWPIWTYQEQLPPAKFVHNEANRRGEAIESSVSAGCILSGSVHNSLLFSNCRVHSYTQIHGAVLLPEVQVGRNVRLTKVVVDRGCRIPDGLVVGEDPDDDARRFYRSEGGVTLITPRMLEKLQG
ncbi:glucose-1-phosphate adenylyltransferase [Lautropia mirabilis]|jgi:glucose-1-phosphate adenylyltransferase|uniref:Glucose-1-phosphate adenylyltransferase n=1 Tax=Lautropia mirabilis ATCC 51599 TaxID=887898 RepID=E7RZ33_9BURK|nr:glucose-1-phosphate adenylyltransferase [Lautropia mirabilis]EFV93832.1 glucose-1-phosphate adenylyltransferase [Lautropia mirabilis ATCC 51599]MBF1247351.1 glucose-1-phosphate adenylyltransferase [Lautropia mirabilis]VEH00337.1 Glucose-1-phosphate adenylyltransferase [Lautropia mirabilis]